MTLINIEKTLKLRLPYLKYIKTFEILTKIKNKEIN